MSDSEELQVRLDQTNHEIKVLLSNPDTAIKTVVLAERGTDGVAGGEITEDLVLIYETAKLLN